MHRARQQTLLSPPDDDRTSFAQPYHFTVDISLTGWVNP